MILCDDAVEVEPVEEGVLRVPGGVADQPLLQHLRHRLRRTKILNDILYIINKAIFFLKIFFIQIPMLQEEKNSKNKLKHIAEGFPGILI